MEQEIIKLYTENDYSINRICEKYRIGKLKVKKILLDNGVTLKKKGGQKKHNFIKVDYSRFEGKSLKCVKTGKVFNDTFNKSGSITTHLQDIYNINPPTLYKRKIITNTTGKLWYEDYFELVETEIKEKWHCPVCDFTTNDLDNRGGFITKHIREHGYCNVREFFEVYPESRINLKEQKIDLENPKSFVKCGICNQPFRSITNTHLNTHNISIEVYGEKYGELFCEDFKVECRGYLDTGRVNIKNNFTSKPQKEINAFIMGLGFNTELNHKKTLSGIEIDIFIPELNVGFEYNGLFWHSEKMGKDKNYHLHKQSLGDSKGVKIYHIFSDEWINKPEIVKNKIKHILGVSGERIYARKCKIREITTKEKQDFLNKTHIQGGDKSKYKIGAFYGDELVAVMTFSNQRVSVGNKHEKDSFELVRFASKNVVGIGSRLLKYFINKYGPKKITSYADRRWTLKPDNLYSKLGFTKVSDGKPNYWYCVSDDKRLHRYNFTKDKLVKKGYDKSKTEKQIMEELGYLRVWDCGNYKYELNIM